MTFGRVPLPALILVACLVLPLAAAGQVSYWDLGDHFAPGQLALFNPDAYDGNTGVPVRTADLTGDGRHEVIITAMNGDGPQNGPARDRAGELHIYFWDGLPFRGGMIDLKQPHPRILEILGEAEQNWFAASVADGDLDGDGYRDLVIGAMGGGEASRYRAGKVYILFGDPALAPGTTIDLASGIPSNMTRILGAEADDRLGTWCGTGDVDNDGWVDLILGSDRADGPGGAVPQAGKVTVLYGPIHPNADIDLADTILRQTISWGIDAEDHFGATVTAGDFDGDGYADIVGAAASNNLSRNIFDTGGSGDGPPGLQRIDSGETWIVWGAASLPDTIELLTPPPGVATTVFYGRHSYARCGEELDVGDVNGDGLPDLYIGSLSSNGPPFDYRRNAGEGYVVYGSAALRNKVYDMALTPFPGVTIYGKRESIATDSYTAGNVNGDAYADIIIGMPHDDGPDNRKAGTVAIIYGGPSLPATIDLANPNVPVTLLEGADKFDDTAYWAAAGDVDGDGYDEVVANAMSGSGWRNARPTAGDARIVSGAWLTLHPEPPPSVTLTLAANQSDIEVTWTDSPTPGVTGYTVHHGATQEVMDGSFYVSSVSGNTGVLTDIVPRQPCYVRVSAVKDGRESRPTAAAVLRTGIPRAPAPSPKLVSPTQVRLSWEAVDDPEFLGYAVYRRLDDQPPTREDRITPGLITQTEFVDTSAPTHAHVRYWVSTFQDGLAESEPGGPARVWTLPDAVGKGALLVNDYRWSTSSNGPNSGFAGDPYEFYAGDYLMGDLEYDFWDFRTGWSLYPPNLNVLGTGTLDPQVLFAHGVTVWVSHGRDSYKDERFLAVEPLLLEYMDRGGVLVMAGWQMGSYMTPGLMARFGIKEWDRPDAVLTTRLLVPEQSLGLPIGPSAATGSAPFCDVPEFLPGHDARPLYRLDTPARPVIFFSLSPPGELERGYVLSASPSYLDPVAVRTSIAPYIERLAQARTETGVPPGGPGASPVSAAFPNPSRSHFQVNFTLGQATQVTARVVDVQGRLVLDLSGPKEPGPQHIRWDGRNEIGRRSPAGIYFLRVETPAFQADRRLILLP